MESNIDQNIERLVKNYRAPAAAVDVVKKMRLALLAGITGAGKDAIKHKLLALGGYQNIVTTITRPPRPGEIDGVSYHFITQTQAIENLKSQKYFEAKIVHERVYGTTTAELEKVAASKNIALADIDVQGVAEYHSVGAGRLVVVFIVPPDFATWKARLEGRGDTLGAEENRRMFSAVHELEFSLKEHYFHFVINDDLDRVVGEVDRLCKGEQRSGNEEARARKIAADLLAEIKNKLNV
ncbi:MAG: hypothetical protein LBM73_02120 [Candidatus Nomurabacteria bacterium]|jgi:guanylate kinase|nr:hypothetical protein [Candidatus Nomurabacteria bacterium]